jgi:hypothetical protein
MTFICGEPNGSTLRILQNHLHGAGGQVEQGQGAGGHVDQGQGVVHRVIGGDVHITRCTSSFFSAEPNESTLRCPQSHLLIAGVQVKQGQGAGGHVDQGQGGAHIVCGGVYILQDVHEVFCEEPTGTTFRLPQSHIHVAGGQVEQGQGGEHHVGG